MHYKETEVIETMDRFYPIGIPGKSWTEADKATWLGAREIQRSYRDEVLQRLEKVDTLLVDKTGTLTEGRPVLADVLAAARVQQHSLAEDPSLEEGEFDVRDARFAEKQ